MAAASDQDVVKTFVKLAILADLDDEEIEALRNEAAKRSGIGKRTIAKMLQEARYEQAAKRQYKAQERALAERSDPRPRLDVPGKDASSLEVMAMLDALIDPPVPRDSKGRALYTVDRVFRGVEPLARKYGWPIPADKRPFVATVVTILVKDEENRRCTLNGHTV